MDSGSIFKPLPGVSLPPLRPELAPVRDAVRTDLPNAVQANVASEQARFARPDRSRAQIEREEELRSRERIDRGFYTDDQTGQLVYRSVNEVTGAVLIQSPEQAVIRLRAYLNAAESKSDDGSSGSQTA